MTDKYTIPLSLFSVVVFILYYSDAATTIEKISGIVTIIIFLILINQKIIVKLLSSSNPLPVMEGLETFFENSFKRTEKLTSKNVRFVNKKSDLLETAGLIQRNPTFIDQFASEDCKKERPSLDELKKRAQRRFELYLSWNKLTENKAVLQLFLPDGVTRIGASIILPLKQNIYDKLLKAQGDIEQGNILRNLASEDIETKNTNNSFFLIDILLKDKKSILEAKHKDGRIDNNDEFLKGISLHLTLWHIAKLSKHKFLGLPNVIIQPDVFGMVYLTYDIAGFAKPYDTFKKEPLPGDYIIINNEIYNKLKRKKDSKKCTILNNCLTILQAYQLTMNKY